jgi:hypothetical protein
MVPGRVVRDPASVSKCQQVCDLKHFINSGIAPDVLCCAVVSLYCGVTVLCYAEA